MIQTPAGCHDFCFFSRQLHACVSQCPVRVDLVWYFLCNRNRSRNQNRNRSLEQGYGSGSGSSWVKIIRFRRFRFRLRFRNTGEETAGGGDEVFMLQGSGSHKTVVLRMHRLQLVHLDSNCGSWHLNFNCPAKESSNLGRAGTFVYSLRAIADAVHFFRMLPILRYELELQ
jgi:hypothetical protein